MRVWDIAKLPDVEMIARFNGLAGPVNALVFLDQEGDWLASASGSIEHPPHGEHTIRIWNVRSGSQVTPSPLTQQVHAATALALSPNRHRLASASSDGTVQLWAIDWSTATPRIQPNGILEGHTDAVLSVAFHPTEPRLASGSKDRMIKIWDLDTKVEVAALRGHAGLVTDLAFDLTGERLASASAGFEGSDNVMRLWETKVSARLCRQRAVAMRAYHAVLGLLEKTRLTLNEARERIEMSSRLPDEVREEALRRFYQLTIDPRWFNRSAWPIVRQPNATDEQYRQALKWAERALRIAPENGYLLNTLGVVQYRLRRYDEALETLTESNKLNREREVADWAFLAMAHYQLGETEAAEDALERARTIMRTDREQASQPDNQDALSEAEQLVTGQSP